VPITVVTGPPGAGKTTISAALARSKQRGVHLPTDHWYHWIVTGYAGLTLANRAVLPSDQHKWCLEGHTM
jgi:adenylate kinase family enzyme